MLMMAYILQYLLLILGNVRISGCSNFIYLSQLVCVHVTVVAYFDSILPSLKKKKPKLLFLSNYRFKECCKEGHLGGSVG